MDINDILDDSCIDSSDPVVRSADPIRNLSREKLFSRVKHRRFNPWPYGSEGVTITQEEIDQAKVEYEVRNNKQKGVTGTGG